MTVPTTPTTGSTSRAGNMINPSGLRMSGKDLINIGIFAALYVAVEYAINMLGFISPVMMLFTLCASVVAAGIPYMLFVTRVRHAGMVSLFGIVTGLFLFLTGHPLVSLGVTVVVAVAADLVLWLGRYRSVRAAVLSYVVFSIWYVGPLLPLFYARDDYFTSPEMAQMGPDYVTKMEKLFTPWVLIGFDVCAVIFGLLGGLLGARLLRKHFRKAGLA